MSKVTVVGCGMMGGNIADAFLDHGHEVTIVDVNKHAAAPRVARGARFTTSLADALDAAFVLLSLPDDNVVRAVLAGCPKDGLAGCIFVNTSSEVPSDVLDVQRIVEEAGGRYIDSCILTYQGEVGSPHADLVYSGDKGAFDLIEDDLRALSDPPVWLGEAVVASEIVDLVAIAVHFGLAYTPLEGLARCAELGIDPEEYLRATERLLPRLESVSVTADEIAEVMSLPEEEALARTVELMDACDLFERFSSEWLDQTNKSVANHYRKMLNIAKSGFAY